MTSPLKDNQDSEEHDELKNLLRQLQQKPKGGENLNVQPNINCSTLEQTYRDC